MLLPADVPCFIHSAVGIDMLTLSSDRVGHKVVLPREIITKLLSARICHELRSCCCEQDDCAASRISQPFRVLNGIKKS